MILRRTGIPPAVWRQPDTSWRLWAHDAALGQPAVGVCAVSFTPLARDRRSIFNATSYYQTADYVIDGLIAAGVIADRRDITDLILRNSTVAGVDGLEVAVLPTERNTTDDSQRHLHAAA